MELVDGTSSLGAGVSPPLSRINYSSFLLDSPLLFALFYEWLAAGSIDPVIWWLVMIVRTGFVSR
jgi:hypothetical protein